MHSIFWTGLVPVVFAVSGATGDPSIVTESELLSKLERGYPAVVERSQELSLAEADRLTAKTLKNPVLEWAREEPAADQTETQWRLSWQLPESGRRFQMAADEKAVDAAAARVDGRLAELRSTMRRDFARWAVASARHRHLDLEVERLAALAGYARARADQGETSGLAAHRLELAETELTMRLSTLAGEESAAAAKIWRWFPDLVVEAVPELPQLPAFGHWSRASEPVSAPASKLGRCSEAGKSAPQWVAAQAEVAAAELRRRASRRFVLSPEVSMGVMQIETPGNNLSGPVIGLSWSLPIFDRKQGARAASVARLEAARARSTMVARELEARCRTARPRYDDLKRAVDQSESALAQASQMLTRAETSFRYGEMTLTDLLAIRRATTEAHFSWLDLYEAALEAHRELEMLTRPDFTMSNIKETNHEAR